MGIVEGITEWLPISSTGHMILLEQIIKFNASEEFMSMFRVVIQLGAIMAVVVLFWGKLWPFGMSLAAIRFLMDYVKRHDFKFFGAYRIVLGIIVLAVAAATAIF